jgi:hypothetical protein
MSTDRCSRIGGRPVSVLALTLAGALAVTLLAAAPALGAAKAVADSYTSSLNPSLNFGSSQRLRIGHNGVGKNNRAYLKFPTAELYDPDCQVTQSTLTFTSNSPPPWGDNFWVAPAAAGWTESTITWENQPDPVTVGAQVNAVWFYVAQNLVFADITRAVQYVDNNAIPGRGLVVRTTTTGDAIDVEEARSREAILPANATPTLSTKWAC